LLLPAGWCVVAAADIATVVKAALLDMDLSISIYLENLDGERQRLETEQRQTFEELSRALQQIGRGDLTVAVSDGLSQATSFSPTFAALCETIVAIRASVVGVSGAADEISQASNNLARRTEQQAASLKQTAAAMDMLTKGVHEAAGQRSGSTSPSRTPGPRPRPEMRSRPGRTRRCRRSPIRPGRSA